MPLTKIAGFFYTFTDGDLLLVPDHCMPFAKEPKKVLADFEAELYLNSPLYESTVEVRIDTSDAVLMPEHIDRKLVTVLGRVEPRLSRGTEQPWVIAERIVRHGDIADIAYKIHLSGRGGSAEDDWLSAENTLLAAAPAVAHERGSAEAG
jgi:hypothetical protein